ncbi:hypothetical protein AB0G15_30715 [Streptosporangium sp. NPDC023825]|uniref:hypothetical protein n=1 Tax=Streptosporangium sp. NPDC023825 TaxID=3154909 RepID=UPI0034431D65
MAATRVRLHDLGSRRDGEEWIVGRVDTGDFAAVPDEGMRVIRLLREGATVREIELRLGAGPDVRGFVRALLDMGLVASLDGRPVPSAEPAPSTFPRLRSRHVSWALSPSLHVAMACVVIAGVVAALLRPEVIPGWRELLWSERGMPVLLGQIATGWSLIFLHELAHLFTARAAGFPGRVKLGTRLQFLAAQTDVSGVWLAGRRVRMTVYLAGMALDATICAAGLLTIALAGARPFLSVVVLTTITMLAMQFLAFMRTDLYFVLQDLTRCRDLYGDAAAYARHLARRVLLRASADPLRHLPRAEARGVRAYTVLLVVGTVLCLGVAVTVTLPVTVGLLAGALGTLAAPADPVATADAVVVILVIVTFQVLWGRTWWRRHRGRVPWAGRRRGTVR